MYFSDVSNEEFRHYHGLTVPNFTIKLSDVLHQTGGVFDNKLFKIEEIIADKLYKIYPMFNTGVIRSSNPDDKVLDNKMVIANKTSDVTYLSFISDETSEVEDYIEYGSYYGIGDSLTTAEFNSIVYYLRQYDEINKPIKFSQSTITGDYGEYDFNIKTGFVDKGILINANHLTTDTDFHVKLSNAVFKTSSYSLHMKAMRISNVNVTDENSEDNITYIDVDVNLVDGVYVHIPTDELQVGDILLYDCSVSILHDNPVIQDWITNLSLDVEPVVIQIGDTATLTATGVDSIGQGVSGKLIYFYELYEVLLDLQSSKSIAQTGDVVDLNVTLKDESDGSIVDEDSVVLFYIDVEE